MSKQNPTCIKSIPTPDYEWSIEFREIELRKIFFFGIEIDRREDDGIESRVEHGRWVIFCDLSIFGYLYFEFS
jgi:hypothetical protein